MRLERPILVEGNKDYRQITEDICRPVETLPGKGWFGYLIPAKLLLFAYVLTIGMIVGVGMGLMGVNHPVGCGYRHRDFCILGGYWSCRYFDFSDFVFISSKVAHGH